ncbi:hypothetical protein DPEC_G00111620 [Dallia pectoralis]|uniref:Uncharacterized protein n=1 Tax=Dallia pectoralis TaxID=75939 RepID=A0ACC2GTI0_DALPE|nr:hypothetical protein DPEC_G00111620 [Dallia pectoralis]
MVLITGKAAPQLDVACVYTTAGLSPLQEAPPLPQTNSVASQYHPRFSLVPFISTRNLPPLIRCVITLCLVALHLIRTYNGVSFFPSESVDCEVNSVPPHKPGHHATGPPEFPAGACMSSVSPSRHWNPVRNTVTPM